jgi:hypothetical protein
MAYNRQRLHIIHTLFKSYRSLRPLLRSLQAVLQLQGFVLQHKLCAAEQTGQHCDGHMSTLPVLF